MRERTGSPILSYRASKRLNPLVGALSGTRESGSTVYWAGRLGFLLNLDVVDDVFYTADAARDRSRLISRR
jgi:hypothetical protein